MQAQLIIVRPLTTPLDMEDGVKVLEEGHRFELDNLKSDGSTVLQFMKDPKLHGGDGCDGPSCQEVVRALISRVKSLDAEKPWHLNEKIIYHARMMIALFEQRALEMKISDGFAVEDVIVGDDGHIEYPQPQRSA